MLRFLGKRLVGRNAELDVITIGQCLTFDEKIWQQGKGSFRKNGYRNSAMLQVVPIMDRDGRSFCFGWQDIEADRELRLLKELEEIGDALQFPDIFPDIKELAEW